MTQQQLYEEARQYFPGGVNSPVRAFKAVGGIPRFFHHGQGALVYDEDGKEYIDFVGSWGPLILGHAHPAVIASLQEALSLGTTFGAPTARETELAALIKQFMPNLELMRFVSSGTEAGMAVIRLARAFTQRQRIIKFAGCYHGHADSLLVDAGSGALTFGQPSSPGIPPELTQYTFVVNFNDTDQVKQLFEKYGHEIAAVIVEPIAGNMNLILPIPEFIQSLRDVCTQYGSLLIFDEVMCGLRVAKGGAQEIYHIKPDLMMLGKIVGGGLPLALYGGRRDIMGMISPDGPVYQAGTLSGNPLATAAGLATLRELLAPEFYNQLNALSANLMKGMQATAQQYSFPLQTRHVGGMFGIFFTDQPEINNLEDAKACNEAIFKAFYQFMLTAGVYFAPSRFETNFMSITHTAAHINHTLQTFEDFVKSYSV